jgi:hypothetical protein
MVKAYNKKSLEVKSNREAKAALEIVQPCDIVWIVSFGNCTTRCNRAVAEL